MDIYLGNIVAECTGVDSTWRILAESQNVIFSFIHVFYLYKYLAPHLEMSPKCSTVANT